jgi:hypothetical protein
MGAHRDDQNRVGPAEKTPTEEASTEEASAAEASSERQSLQGERWGGFFFDRMRRLPPLAALVGPLLRRGSYRPLDPPRLWCPHIPLVAADDERVQSPLKIEKCAAIPTP